MRLLRRSRDATVVALVSLLVTSSASGARARVRTPDTPLVVNERLLSQQHPVAAPTYDSHPVFTLDEQGRGCVVWHSYARSGEWIVGRTLPTTDDANFLPLSGERGVVMPPELATDAEGAHAVVWSSWKNGRWQLWGRRGAATTWHPAVALTPPGVDCLYPSIEHLAPGVLALAWVQLRAGRFEIAWARWTTQGLEASQIISAADSDAFRPMVMQGRDGTAWIFWDAYAGKTYAVYARAIAPQLGPIERVSSSPDRCFRSVAACAGDGTMYSAWVKAVDISGGAGAIDQRHSLQVARREAGSWQVLSDADGDAAANLAPGLLAQIEPQPVPTGGFLGRRRAPLLVRDGAAVWLLWERKASQTGSTTLVTGDVIGRKISGALLGHRVVVATGAVDYHVAQAATVQDGKLPLLSSSLPRDGQRSYTLKSVVLADARPDKPAEPWAGWNPIALPLPESEPQRHELREEGKTYRLYWMDSHVHSGLTADAEGEPDEILYYGRDRGQLDTLVMQENDFFNCPLMDWEYQLGMFFGRALSRDGTFVALPGFEWTQRLPADKSLPADQPRFWTGHNPNHRTVIYPRAGGPLIRYVDVNNDIHALYDAVEKAGGVMHTQHPQFEFTGAAPEVAIEVTAGWGLYFLNPGLIHATLNRGFRAAFVGTSDSHRRNPGLGGGLTAIYATALTPEALIEAYRARRVYATNGSRIVLETRANGTLMGQDATPGKNVRLTAQVKGTRPLRRATLIRDGTDLKTWARADAALQATFEFDDHTAAPGAHWYYWRIEQEGISQHYGGNVATAFGNLAWSTPNWIRIE